MLPPFAPSGLLPPGIHRPDDWSEIERRFGGSACRLQLLAGLGRVIAALRRAGCTALYLDGSFATSKSDPSDFDGCWDITGVDASLLDPVLLDFKNGRAAQKAAFGGEVFPAHFQATPTGQSYLDFFQTDKTTGNRKGIIQLDPRSLTP